MQDPDGHEKAIRFGCGFLFGLLFAFGNGFFLFSWQSTWPYVAAFATCGTVFGVIATHYGDGFWLNLRKWLFW